MKLSRFSYLVDDYPEPAKATVYNGRTEALLVLNREVRDLLRKLPQPFESLTPAEQSALATLEERGVVVRREVDENQVMRDWFRDLRFSTKKLEVMILTTFDCNFDCPYCFEDGVKRKQYLEEPKADDIVQWIKQKIIKKSPQELHLIFYGGEPLLNIPIIEYISNWLKQVTEFRGMKFSFSLVTNGVRLTRRVAERLRNYGLKMAKITVDGPKEIHDQFRPFKSGRGSFDIIMKNIKGIADIVQVQIGANFNATSYPHLRELLDTLEGEGLRDKIAMIDFKPITARPTAITVDAACPTHETDPEYADQILEIKKEFIRRGFKTPEPLGTGFCEFKAADMKVIIDSDGYIYKCPSMAGMRQFACGTVTEELEQNPRFQEIAALEVVDFDGQCRTCEFIPVCAGSCNWMSYLKKGDYTKVYCEKKIYKKIMGEMVKLKYEHEMARKRRKARFVIPAEAGIQ